MINLKFSKSFDECLQQAYRFHTGFLTDKTAFTAISTKFADPFADDFLTDIEAADALPTLEDDLGQQMLLTNEVEEKMEEARLHYQKLMFNVNVAWPGDEPIARVFGNALYDNARKSTLKLINLIQNAYNNANSTTYKTGLISAGFIQADIDLLNSLADDITTRNNAQEDYMMKTFERTETKNKAFNKVWDSMVLLSDASKIIFKDSPAKIEYYLLYPETPISNPPGVPELNYAPGEFYWDEVPNATSYELVYRASSETEWNELYSGPYPTGSIPFAPGDGEWIARLRARNSGGYGDWSEEKNVFIGLRAPENVNLTFLGAPDNFLRLTWSPVIGADYVEVWRSVVTLGFPAGDFTMQGTIPASPYQQVATLAMRHYYYLIAKNATQTSPASVTVFFDVPV